MRRRCLSIPNRSSNILAALASIRLLLPTGNRDGAIPNLRREEIDLEAGELHLADSKIGRRIVELLPDAVSVLSRIPRLDGNLHVIPGKVPGRPMYDQKAPWKVECTRSGLGDVRVSGGRARGRGCGRETSVERFVQAVAWEIAFRGIAETEPSMTHEVVLGQGG